MKPYKRISKSALLCFAGLPLLLLLACQMPVGPTLTSSAGTHTATTPSATSVSSEGGASSSGGFSLTVDSSANQGVLLTPDGKRVLIQATGSDGSLVKCISPVSIATLKSDSSNKSAEKSEIVVGKTDKGSAGIWIYTSEGKFKSIEHEGSGHSSSKLPESDDHKGDFRSSFGWTYHVVDMSEDGKIVVGYAENKKGLKLGPLTVDPGTTVGVYWRIWSRHHDGHRHLWVSTARIIGTLDTSAFHSKGWGHRSWLGFLFHRALERLKLFLVNYYSDYLTTVEKKLENNTKAITFDESNDVYQISGQDQDGQDAIATLGSDGKITIESTTPPPPPPPSTSVDLAPGLMTVSQTELADGGKTVSGTLVLTNVGTAAYSGDIPVDFWVSPSSTFAPSSTNANATTTYTENIGAGAQVTVNYSFTMPTLGTSADQAVYIYADVDPTGSTTGDVDLTNNLSTPANAGVLFVYSGSGGYSLDFVTYNPSTGATGAGAGTPSTQYSANTVIVLYKANGSGVTPIAYDNVAATDYYGHFTATGLTAGTYYILVFVIDLGAYALNVTTPNIDLKTFSSIANPPPSTANQSPSVSWGSVQSYSGTPPSTPYPVAIGNAENWYGTTSGECDWFTFTLY